MVRLKGETSAAFSAFSSATDFCLTGAVGGAVLGRGDGKMFWPSCTDTHTHSYVEPNPIGNHLMERLRDEFFFFFKSVSTMVGL